MNILHTRIDCLCSTNFKLLNQVKKNSIKFCDFFKVHNLVEAVIVITCPGDQKHLAMPLLVTAQNCCQWSAYITTLQPGMTTMTCLTCIRNSIYQDIKM